MGESEKLCKWLTKPTNFLIVSGPPGVGKTYLLSAIVGELPSSYQWIRAFNERSFIGRIRDGIEKYNNYDFIKEIQLTLECHMFILDDFGCSTYTDWRSDVLTEALDYCYSNQVPTIITTNLDESEILQKFHPRIYSRLFAKENVFLNLFDMPDLRQEGK